MDNTNNKKLTLKKELTFDAGNTDVVRDEIMINDKNVEVKVEIEIDEETNLLSPEEVLIKSEDLTKDLINVKEEDIVDGLITDDEVESNVEDDPLDQPPPKRTRRDLAHSPSNIEASTSEDSTSYEPESKAEPLHGAHFNNDTEGLKEDFGRSVVSSHNPKYPRENIGKTKLEQIELKKKRLIEMYKLKKQEFELKIDLLRLQLEYLEQKVNI